MGIIKISNTERLNNILKLIEESTQPIQNVYSNINADDHVSQQAKSHHNLEQIFNSLWGNGQQIGIVKRGSFEDIVFRLVFFHQSFALINLNTPDLSLSSQELYQ